MTENNAPKLVCLSEVSNGLPDQTKSRGSFHFHLHYCHCARCAWQQLCGERGRRLECETKLGEVKPEIKKRRFITRKTRNKAEGAGTEGEANILSLGLPAGQLALFERED